MDNAVSKAVFLGVGALVLTQLPQASGAQRLGRAIMGGGSSHASAGSRDVTVVRDIGSLTMPIQKSFPQSRDIGSLT